jgi:hypothetical protein
MIKLIIKGKIATLLTTADKLHSQLPNYSYVLNLYKSMDKSVVRNMQENMFKQLRNSLDWLIFSICSLVSDEHWKSVFDETGDNFLRIRPLGSSLSLSVTIKAFIF